MKRNGIEVSMAGVHRNNGDFLKCSEQYEGTDAIIEYVAEIEGDGVGYDIKITTTNKKEIRIEVKNTKKPYVDGFYLTPRELNAARQCLFVEAIKWMSYRIYRVYNFDPKKTANEKVFDYFDEHSGVGFVAGGALAAGGILTMVVYGHKLVV